MAPEGRSLRATPLNSGVACGPKNFIDMDVLVVGPVVHELASIFGGQPAAARKQ
jgi:phosphatidylserine/phosphatidylglycerophosphate/cardiolipin synthase-like enzyme